MTETELLARYTRHGLSADLDQIVRRYQPIIYAAALRQVRDPHLAQDITQTSLLTLTRKAAKIPRHQPIGPWLLRVTHYLAIDALRNISARRRHERRFAGEHREPQEIGRPPWRNIEPVLDAALHALSERDRIVLTLRYLQACSIEEISRDLGLDPPSVRQRISRALRRLRKILTQHGYQRDDLLPLAVPWWLRLKNWLRRFTPIFSWPVTTALCSLFILASSLIWCTGATHKTPLASNPPAITKSSGLRAQSTIP